jgi:hypothetical protein
MSRSEWVEEPVLEAAKRCGVQWAHWMGDWFTSWSPRNMNNYAEGSWDHWVELAVGILQDPLTKVVRPEAFEAAAPLVRQNFYDESNRRLTDEELAQRFPEEATS